MGLILSNNCVYILLFRMFSKNFEKGKEKEEETVMVYLTWIWRSHVALEQAEFHRIFFDQNEGLDP
jgi:hypothetical protein